MSATTRRNQAAWELVAIDLSDDLGHAADRGTHGIAQVADRTGLSRETIEDCLYRAVVTQVDNPRTYLCRPRYRVHSTPYWSDEQVAEAARAAAKRRVRTGQAPARALVAADADVIGIRDISRAVARHEQTVRKWTSGSYTAASVKVDDPPPFPEPKGSRPQPPGRRQGNPETVYDRAEVDAWVRLVMGIEAPALASREATAALYAERIGVQPEVMAG